MLDKIIVFTQNSIKFDLDKKIYIDPIQIKDNFHDADVIFITHDHYDHFSKDDIYKVSKKDTIIVAPYSMKDLITDFSNVILVEVNNNYKVLDISFSTVPAYNVSKHFHPREKQYVGYIITLENYRYYIAGDTDNIDEIQNVVCDVAFLPIGGTFTMDYKEAYELVEKIRPKVVVPVHYGSIVGEIEDGLKFKKMLDSINVECQLLIK